MKNKIMRGLVTSVTEVSPVLRKITFRLSQGLEYQPGQSVRIRNQLYSLCSGPEAALRTNTYEILVEKQPLGARTESIEHLKVGDLIKVEGPFGEFFPLEAQPFEEIVWLATPAQLGSFLSCVQSKRFLSLRPLKVLLVVEVSDEREFPFRDVFEANGVNVISCVTQPTRWVEGFWGKMVDFLKSKRLKLDFLRARFFLAVDEALGESLRSALLEERKVSELKIELLNPLVHEKGAKVISFPQKTIGTERFLKAA